MSSKQSSNQHISINPLRLSPPLGAVLAFLGLEKALPVLHGAQGCAAFAKTLLTRHFREPIPLQTTALRQEHVIMGSESGVVETLRELINKHHPAVIGLITTALTETAGDDMEGIMTRFRSAHPFAPPIVVVHAAEYSGSLTTGYVAALHALVNELLPQGAPAKQRSVNDALVNLVFGPTATTGEVDDVKDLFAAFGFEPIAFPDLSTSLDGHLGQGLSGVTSGGLALLDASRMKDACMTFSFAKSVAPVGRRIAALAGHPHILVPPLNAIGTIDQLVEMLVLMRGVAVPGRLLRERDRFQDRMLDAHSCFAGVRVAVAGEPDWLDAMELGLAAMGADVVAAFSSVPPRSCGYEDTWQVGDFDQLEQYCSMLPKERRPDLLLANSHGKQTALRLGAEFWSLGLPVWDRLGAPSESGVMYRGACDWITRIGNILLAAQEKSLHGGSESHEDCLCHG